MEIARKYLVAQLPTDYTAYPSSHIEQGYLNTSPVVRVRKEDETYYLTYKGKGLLAREEYNLPLTQEAYAHLIQKADGIVLTKRRYKIPLDSQYPEGTSPWQTAVQDTAQTDQEKGQPPQSACPPADPLVIELDVFEGTYAGLVLAEVEFPTVEAAEHFTPPAWFGRDVTFSGGYQNSRLSTALQPIPKNGCGDCP